MQEARIRAHAPARTRLERKWRPQHCSVTVVGFGNVFGYQIGFFLRQDIELARLRRRLQLTSFTNRFLNGVCIPVVEWVTVVR
ncbi:unnamed protein product [Nezara viridula]|uniref:Uncharacterized protein n=1 Tax=Nezara viridula TaxID=85310 RepID=A0A9P0HA72_NEZVI|nr:unnamed protein product [Nezara viridula]